MGKIVSASSQKAAAESMASALSSMDGVSAEVSERTSGTNPRNVVSVDCSSDSWRHLAECLRVKHGVDHCSMVTGIHWPEGGPDKNWEVVYHFMRMAISEPPVIDGMVQPIMTDPSSPRGKEVPLEIEVRVALPETREPKVASVQDIWAGADWNEKVTWDLVGIDFEGHVGCAGYCSRTRPQWASTRCRSSTSYATTTSRRCTTTPRASSGSPRTRENQVR